KFDWLGTLVISVMLASFVYGTNQIETHKILSSIISRNVYPFLLGAFALLIALIYIEGEAHNPIVAPSLFGSRQLKIAHVLSFGSGFFQASLIYLPTFAIAAFFVSSSVSSFMLLPTVFAVAIASPLFGRMLDKQGSKVVISIGTLILSAGILILAIFITNWYMFFISTALIGFGLSALLGAPIRYILLNEVSETNRSSAQGIITIFTSSGQLIGAAVIGAIINSGNNPVVGFRKAFITIGVIAAALYIFSNYLKGRQEEVQGLTEVTEV
ncbi:MAG: MFS transporter, partial [Bacillota bacterium]